VQSRFFTMDVAKRVDGGWMIVELGDGQVAGLPVRADVGAFYRVLAGRLG
jgi:ATP-grasp domain-containing protein